MLKHLKPAILASSLALTGCWNMSYISTIENPKIEEKYPFNKITDDSEIGQYFLSNVPVPLNKSRVMDELEERVEYSASVYFGRKVEIATPLYAEAGQRIILANLGELGIIEVQSIPLIQLTEKQKEAATYYAEREGLNVTLPPPLEEILEKQKYAAHVDELGGFAFSLIFTNIIFFDHDKRSLYSVVNTLAHEPTHHFFEAAEPLWQWPILLYPNERMSINETSCNLIGDRVALQFQKDHLIPESELDKEFTASIERSEKVQEVWQEVIRRFIRIPEEKKKTNRNPILEELSEYATREIGFKFELNEAIMSLAERYGGEPQRYELMEGIVDKLGPTGFIALVSDVHTDLELKIAYNCIVPENKKLCAIPYDKRGNISGIRSFLRQKDTEWIDILKQKK